MIRYIRDSYWGQVFVLRGGILVSLVAPIATYFLYCLLTFCLGFFCNIQFFLSDDDSSMHMLAHCVSFLLVFRLHQCHTRYDHAAELCSRFFTDVNSLVGIICSYSNSLDDKPESQSLVLATQVHVARLMIAMGVALKFHCRTAENALLGGKLSPEKAPLVLFDYFRIKGLLCSREQAILHSACGLKFAEESNQFSFHVQYAYRSRQDRYAHRDSEIAFPSRDERGEDDDISSGSGGIPLPVVIMQFFRIHMGKAIREKIMVERVLNLIEGNLRGIETSFSQLDQLIVMPLPLAYLQHCKVIFLAFVIVYPLTLDTFDGFWANVISPGLICMALFGLEVLADAMENPLGDDVLDMNVMEMIHELELRIQKTFNISVAHRELLLEDSQELVGHVTFPGVQPKVYRKKSTQRIISPTGQVGIDRSFSRRFSSAGRTSSSGMTAKSVQDMEKDIADYNRFESHFCWQALPPHVENHIKTMAFGDVNDIPFADKVTEVVRQRMSDYSWSQDSACYQAFGYRSFTQIATEIFPEHTPTVTHFLCLNMRSETMQDIMRSMAKAMAPEDWYREYMQRECWNSGESEPEGSDLEEIDSAEESDLAFGELGTLGSTLGAHDLRQTRDMESSKSLRKSAFRQPTVTHARAKDLLSTWNDAFRPQWPRSARAAEAGKIKLGQEKKARSASDMPTAKSPLLEEASSSSSGIKRPTSFDARMLQRANTKELKSALYHGYECKEPLTDRGEDLGGFKHIFMGRRMRDKMPCVLCFAQENCEQTELKHEAELLQLCGKHPNVIELLEYIPNWGGDDIDKSCLILELVTPPGNDLWEVFQAFNATGLFIPTSQLRWYVQQLAEGLQFINQKGIVHRDIKAENLLVDSDHNVKIIDFGLGVCPPRLTSTLILTGKYFAPELESGGDDFEKIKYADLWGIGCVLYYLSTGDNPITLNFKKWNVSKRFQTRVAPKLKSNREDEKVFGPILEQLLQIRPEARGSFQDVTVWSQGEVRDPLASRTEAFDKLLLQRWPYRGGVPQALGMPLPMASSGKTLGELNLSEFGLLVIAVVSGDGKQGNRRVIGSVNADTKFSAGDWIFFGVNMSNFKVKEFALRMGLRPSTQISFTRAKKQEADGPCMVLPSI